MRLQAKVVHTRGYGSNMTFVMLGNMLIILVNLDDAQKRLDRDDDDDDVLSTSEKGTMKSKCRRQKRAKYCIAETEESDMCVVCSLNYYLSCYIDGMPITDIGTAAL